MQRLIHFTICTISTGLVVAINHDPEHPYFYLHDNFIFVQSNTDVTIGLNGSLTVIGKIDIQWCPLCSHVVSNNPFTNIVCLNENCGHVLEEIEDDEG